MSILQFGTSEFLQVESTKESYTFYCLLHCIRKLLTSKELSPKTAQSCKLPKGNNNACAPLVFAGLAFRKISEV